MNCWVQQHPVVMTARWWDQDVTQVSQDAQLTDWLQERGSLTARLRDTWPDVAVQVLNEGVHCPLAHEAQRLGMPESAAAWVRCVLLSGGGQARVYARTVIPNWTPDNPWAEVQRLGNLPLGELLFRLPDLSRSAFEWSRGLLWPVAHAQAWVAVGSSAAPCARRCVFGRAGAPLLLTEVFVGVP